jgi:hypothetical protein
MKLAAIYNIWDGIELLQGSVKCLKDHVDVFIIVWQDVSNFGESYSPLADIPLDTFEGAAHKVFPIKYDPVVGAGMFNEKKKRNIGLDMARAHGCTHFLHIDCDEYYEDFGKAKELFIQSGKPGSVCKLYTYFKLPTLRFENPDGYFVPFIHELREDTQAGVRHYPFYVDPTRRINETDVVELPVFMHHFSWVRKDIEKKCRNSSAKENIENGTMLLDYHSPEVSAGYYVQDYCQKLVEVPDLFDLHLP